RLRDRFRAQAAGDEQTVAGEPPRGGGIERDAGTAGLTGDEGVEQQVVSVVRGRPCGEVLARTGSDCLDGPRAEAAVDGGSLVAVKLDRPQRQTVRQTLHARAGRIDEHADETNAGDGGRDGG